MSSCERSPPQTDHTGHLGRSARYSPSADLKQNPDTTLRERTTTLTPSVQARSRVEPSREAGHARESRSVGKSSRNRGKGSSWCGADVRGRDGDPRPGGGGGTGETSAGGDAA